ncbi:MAG: serine/threonine-protein kinase [Myxococcota bacterium]
MEGSPGEDRWEGRILGRRFRLLSPIDRGGVGVVYRAQDLEGGEVAVKLLRSELFAIPQIAERFERELELSSAIAHPNVIRSIARAKRTSEDPAFLVTEFVEGETLAHRIHRAGRLGTEPALRIMKELLAGLAAIHDAGVVHRDLKPSNVLLSAEDERVKIFDFGMATYREGLVAVGLTPLGLSVGTPSYCSPERIRGGVAPASAADIYSVGVMLFEMLTGALPFAGSSHSELCDRILTAPPPPTRVFVPGGVEPRLESIIHACLAKEPGNRPISACAVRDVIDTASR